MSPQAKKEYIQAILERYKEASKGEKSSILNEFCQVTGYHRKWAIEKINTYNPKVPKKKPGRRSKYNNETIIEPLKKVWFAANLPCSIRLKAMMPYWIESLPELPLKVKMALLKMSPATMDRVLKPSRIQFKRRGKCTTKPGTLLKKQVPLKCNQWNEKQPGFLEADTVAHCGTYLDGQFVYTLNCVDIATGWTEQRAVWGKGETGILDQIKDIQGVLPFKILGFDSDNGSEFLNYHLLKHCQKHNIQFTRCRPYHKDDNAHIEQKNWTHVRQWLGYYRFDNRHVVPLINELYKNEWRLFHNFFLPSVKLLQKQRIGSKTIKRHDKPKTPYQRILESKNISQSIKDKLRSQHSLLDPFALRNTIERRLKKIFVVARALVYAPSIS